MFFRKIPKNIKDYPANSILIIGLSSIGDNLFLTPSIKQIRDKYKKAEIDIVVGPRAVEFAKNNSWFADFYVWDKTRVFKLISRLRRKKYDLVFDFRNSLIPFFIRGRYKFTFFIQEFFSDKTFTHESERMLKFLEPYFGKPADTRLYFPVAQPGREKIEKIFKSLGIKKSDVVIVMNPGAAFIAKRWDKKNFIDAGKELLRQYDAKIVIIGNKQEKELGDDIKNGIANKDVFNLAGETTLGECAALLEVADIIITNDTGSMHLASAVGCPVVAIFGPGNPYRYGPIGTKNYILHTSLNCFPCKVEAKCKKNFVCMSHTSVNDVINAVSVIIDEKKQLNLFEFE